MATYGTLDLAARRNELRTWTWRFVGVDWSAAAFVLQIRNERDTPGAALIALGNVDSLAAEGLKATVATEGGVPVTTITGRLNKSTMGDATKVPYAGELGDDYRMVYGLQIDGTTRLVGGFWALASAIDSDAAPVNRPSGSNATRGPATYDTASLTIAANEVIEVLIDGVGLLGPLLVQASAAAEEAQAAAASVLATKVILDDSHFADLADNLYPETVTFGLGECIVDRAGLLGDGVNSFILPDTIEVRKGRVIYTGAPVQPFNDGTTGQASVLAGHLVLHANGDAASPQVIWYEPASNRYRINRMADFIANLANDDVGQFDKVCLLAVITGDRVFGKVPFRSASDGIGVNGAPWGDDVTQAPYRYGASTVIPVTDAVLTSRGITQAVRGDTQRTSFVGPSAVPVKQGGRVFIRGWVTSNEDNQFGPTAGVTLWSGSPENSTLVGATTARLERVWSARVHSYVASFPAPAGMGGFSFGIGPAEGNSPTSQQAIAALQYTYGDAPAQWLRWDDFSVPANAALLDIDATFPATIYLRAGRPLDFNPANALSDMSKMEHVVASVASVGSRAARPLVKSSQGTIELDPARMGGTVTVGFQDSRTAGKNGYPNWKSQDLNVIVGSRTDAQVGLILTDSKGQQSLASDLKAKYEAIAGAGKLTMIGTIADGDNTNVNTEGHRGWSVSDITHDNAQYPAVATNLRVPGYRQSTPNGVATGNVFIVPDNGSYPAGVARNGYAFDLRRYLTDFGFADPNFVVVELGVNDFGQYPDDTALAAALTRNWQIIYGQTRAALPNARIIFAQWGLGHPDFNQTPEAWARFHKFLIRQQRQFVASLSDANCIFVGMYLHVDRLISYPPYVTATDQYGLQSLIPYDSLHEGAANRSAGAEAILGAISYSA